MLFDTISFDKSQCPSDSRSLGELKCSAQPYNEMLAVGFWQEHCIECGAPACYETCDKFSPTKDGRCRRFRYGIKRISGSGGRNGYAVHFQPWGKLEMHYTGLFATRERISLIEKVDILLSPVVRWLNMLLTPNRIRKNVVSVYRRLRDGALSCFCSGGCRPSTWYIECMASGEECLRLSVVIGGGEEVVSTVFNIHPGINSMTVKIPVHQSRNMYFKVFSIDGTKDAIVFTRMEILAESKKQVATPAKYVKCLVWDLDNTLWSGVLANDGEEGVSVRHEAIETIKKLDERGILNSICSKNDYELAWKKLKTLGISEYFVFPEINWNPKSVNIKLIAANMNIGIDTLAFIDDSPHERGEVAERLPMVRVYSENQVTGIPDDIAFNPPISDESKNRRMSYLAEMQRVNTAKTYSGSHNDFLRDCEIVLECGLLGENDAVSLKRCWELVNRTNQLTLAARRYSEDEFRNLVTRKGILAYAVRCRDKYGEYGIVGFIAIERISSDFAEVREFVMSCRVAKKKCEQSILLAVADRMGSEGVKHIAATIVPTGRNSALIEAFDEVPFDMVEDGSSRRDYTLDVDKLHKGDVFTNRVIFIS